HVIAGPVAFPFCDSFCTVSRSGAVVAFADGAAVTFAVVLLLMDSGADVALSVVLLIAVSGAAVASIVGRIVSPLICVFAVALSVELARLPSACRLILGCRLYVESELTDRMSSPDNAALRYNSVPADTVIGCCSSETGHWCMMVLDDSC
ncbi:hypothetical protein BVRB_040400, partial [Beta vulgaris subsp. vulgaris]